MNDIELKKIKNFVRAMMDFEEDVDEDMVDILARKIYNETINKSS